MGYCHSKDEKLPGAPHPLPGTEQVDRSARTAARYRLPDKATALSRGGYQQFIFSRRDNVREVYQLSKKLGEGAYGFVCSGTHRESGHVRAVKSIPKRHLQNVDSLKQEIEIMKLMDHPNIIQLYETFEDASSVFLVMELCTGGELFDRILEAHHFTEADAAIVMQQILRAVFYMHSQDVCHRDLKPENFLLLNQEVLSKNILKVIDFGLSTHSAEGAWHTTKAGTPYYVAPQVLQGNYQRSCDMWSCGAIMYTILSGYPPFNGADDEETFKKVRSGKVIFPHEDWGGISEEAQDLIRWMLKILPRERCMPDEALNHAWIKDRAPSSRGLSLSGGLVGKLQNFASQNKLKKAALAIIASQLDDVKVLKLREVFLAMDANGDGTVTQKELKDGLREAGFEEVPNDDTLKHLMQSVDADGSGSINYTEFLASTLDRKTYLREEQCRGAFDLFDLNGDGKITMAELKQVLQLGNVKEVLATGDAQQIMDEVDRNGDGTIDFDEFMIMMGLAPGKRIGELPAPGSSPEAAVA